MKVVLSPLESDLTVEPSIFIIGRIIEGTNWYSYGICKWANGLQGAIIDFADATDDVDAEGKSLIHTGDGRDFLSFVSSDIDLVQESEKVFGLNDLSRKCPLVADGIIARFVKIDITKRNYPAMFEAYYEMEKKFYVLDHQRRDPFSFSKNLEDEFVNGAHLRIESKNIDFSTENLFPFLKESDRRTIKRMAEAYIEFVKSKAIKISSPEEEIPKSELREELNALKHEMKSLSRSIHLNPQREARRKFWLDYNNGLYRNKQDHEETPPPPPSSKEGNNEEANEQIPDIPWEVKKQCFKDAVLYVMMLKKKKGGYLFHSNTHWIAIYRYAEFIKIMYELDNPESPKGQTQAKAQYSKFAEFSKELSFDVSPPTRLPFKLNSINGLSKKNYNKFLAPPLWQTKDLKGKGLTLCKEMNAIYKALQKKYDDLIQQASQTNNT